jgi:hypothetical protein
MAPRNLGDKAMKITKYDRLSIVKAIMADVPKPDKNKRRNDIQAAIVKAMNPAVRKVFKDFPGALRTNLVGEFVCNDRYDSRYLIVGDVDEKVLEEIFKPYREEDTARHNAQAKLYDAIDSCTTRKALMDRLPEFEKYFPTEAAPTKNLPALANVVADLSKLGWPKSKTK